MALLFFTGFEGQEARNTGLWSEGATNFTVTSGAGRNGGAALVQNNVGQFSATIPVTDKAASSSTYTLGFAMYIPATDAGQADNMCTVTVEALNGDNSIIIRRNPAGANGLAWCVQGQGGTTCVTWNLTGYDAWHYVEVKWTLHATTGTVEVRYNGVAVGSASNVSTQVGSSIPQQILLSSLRYGRIDDIYLLDSTGASPYNYFLGDVKVLRSKPIADSAVTWTPNSGATNYTQVDDDALDGDTTYVQTEDGSGRTDMYGFSDITLNPGESIASVKLSSVAMTTTAGAANLVLKANTQESANKTTTNSYALYKEYFNTSDGTTPWNETSFNAMTAGIKAV